MLLDRCIGSIEPLIQDILGTSRSRFVEALFATLQSITEQSEDNPAAHCGGDIYWLSERLMAATKVVILRELGFTDGKIGEIIEKSAQMGWVKGQTAPWDAKSHS